MSTLKRRVIEDEEDTSNADGKASMVDRLKRRLAKSAGLAQQKNKRKKLQTENNVDSHSLDESSNASKIVKKPQSIPKKPKKTQTIPKKSDDDNNAVKNEENKVKKETTSLLSGMKKPPMPKANVSKSVSGGGKGNHSSTKNKTKPFHSSSMPPKQTPGSPSRLSPVKVASTPPPVIVNLSDISGPQDVAAPRIKVEEGGNDKFGSGLRQLVLDGLKDLCKDSFEKPPERHGVDLFASFLRHKDLNETIQTSSNNIDNSSGNQRYDFFDVDETTGTVVLQQKIPIFPEDFPAGVKEWPLSWWGIVEPSIDEKIHEDKAGQRINADTNKRSKSRRDRSGAKSDSGKESSGDRHKRDSSRNSRRRASKDTREDRFAGGEYDDYGGGYPPQLHGIHYDYDQNGRSPNEYNSTFGNPHHRGGGQTFPHRTRDGRLYPHDAPPPVDFRGGGRSYSARGDNGPSPWEYSHRDPHGPQGRGPPTPPSRDDKREHRDRSHRSTHSKSERDDGRHSGRKGSSSSSSRKDRIRSSR